MENLDDIVNQLREKFGKIPSEEKAALHLGCLMAEHNIMDLKTLIDIQMLANSLIRYCEKDKKHMISGKLLQFFKNTEASN